MGGFFGGGKGLWQKRPSIECFKLVIFKKIKYIFKKLLGFSLVPKHILSSKLSLLIFLVFLMHFYLTGRLNVKITEFYQSVLTHSS